MASGSVDIGAGVSTVNNVVGPITLAAGVGIAVATSGSTITVSNSSTVTTPVVYTPTLANASGIGSSNFLWYRNGIWLFIDGQVLFTSQGTAANFTITLPPAAGTPAIDTALLVGGTNTANASATVLGDGFWFDTGTAWKSIWPKFVTTTTVGFWVVTQAFANDLSANGDSLNFRIKLPIVGWS